MAAYEPNQAYRYSAVNGLPRHVVPQADVVVDGENGSIVLLDKGTSFSLLTDKYGDRRFLAEVSNCQPLKLEPAFNNWQHHQKALAQAILPFLFVGPMAVARDPGFIQTNNITMLVAVRDGKAASINPKIMDPTRFTSAEGVDTATFDVLDELDLIRRFSTILKRMNDHLMARTEKRPITKLTDIGGRILVFCEAGDKRSAALATLFFMVVFGLSALSAVQAVQSRRYGININGDLYRVLQNCEEVLKAERQTAASSVQNDGHNNVAVKRLSKRTIHEAQKEDEDMEMVYDDENHVRIGTAPFRDADM